MMVWRKIAGFVIIVALIALGFQVFPIHRVVSEDSGIGWVYQSSPTYRDLYLREAAVCGDIAFVSPVSVASDGEFYPFTQAIDVTTGSVMWTASVGGHIMCARDGLYLLDDYNSRIIYMSVWGNVENIRPVPILRGRMFARTNYGIAVLLKDGTVYLMGSGLTGGATITTSYPPVMGSTLVSDGDMLFWKTWQGDRYAIVGFNIAKTQVVWVRQLNVHKSYIVPYGKYLFVSGFEKLYVLSKQSGTVLRSYDVAYYEPYIVISHNKLLIPRKDWLDVFDTDNGLLVRVYKDSDMVFSAYSIAGSRVINVDSDAGRAYACTITPNLSCDDRSVWTFSDAIIMGDKVYGTGLNFVVPVKDGWLVFLTYRTIPVKYINGFEIIFLKDKGVSPTGEWETPFGGPDGDNMP